MPNYTYFCDHCESEDFERLVTIKERDRQCCRSCGTKLDRKIDAPAMVWSPTKNGGYS